MFIPGGVPPDSEGALFISHKGNKKLFPNTNPLNPYLDSGIRILGSKSPRDPSPIQDSVSGYSEISHTDTFCEDRWPIKKYRQPTVGGLRQINYCRLCPGDPNNCLGTPTAGIEKCRSYFTHVGPLPNYSGAGPEWPLRG